MSGADLRYTVKYAKSGRSSCQACKRKIAYKDVRIGDKAEHPCSTEMIWKWYHPRCFFENRIINSTAEIVYSKKINCEDQAKIKELLEKSLSSGVVRHFKIDMPKKKGPLANCCRCPKQIERSDYEPRISYEEYESKNARKFGPQTKWHHLQCFVDCRKELKFFKSGHTLCGFESLSEDQKRLITERLPEIEQGDVPEDAQDPVTERLPEIEQGDVPEDAQDPVTESSSESEQGDAPEDAQDPVTESSSESEQGDAPEDAQDPVTESSSESEQGDVTEIENKLSDTRLE